MKTEFFMLTKQLPHKFWSSLFYKKNGTYYQRMKTMKDVRYLNGANSLFDWKQHGYLDTPIFAWED